MFSRPQKAPSMREAMELRLSLSTCRFFSPLKVKPWMLLILLRDSSLQVKATHSVIKSKWAWTTPGLRSCVKVEVAVLGSRP